MEQEKKIYNINQRNRAAKPTFVKVTKELTMGWKLPVRKRDIFRAANQGLREWWNMNCEFYLQELRGGPSAGGGIHPKLEIDQGAFRSLSQTASKHKPTHSPSQVRPPVPLICASACQWTLMAWVHTFPTPSVCMAIRGVWLKAWTKRTRAGMYRESVVPCEVPMWAPPHCLQTESCVTCCTRGGLQWSKASEPCVWPLLAF